MISDPRIFVRSVRTLRQARVAAIPRPPGVVQCVPPAVDELDHARQALNAMSGDVVVELLLDHPEYLDHLKLF
jgi:hypothetical protein